MKYSTAPWFVSAALFLLPSFASADLLPPDECSSDAKEGDECENAGKSANQSGVCKKQPEQCSRRRGGQNGTVEKYDCFTCEVDGDGGCSVPPHARDPLTGGCMAAIGALAFWWSRRKRA